MPSQFDTTRLQLLTHVYEPSYTIIKVITSACIYIFELGNKLFHVFNSKSNIFSLIEISTYDLIGKIHHYKIVDIFIMSWTNT